MAISRHVRRPSAIEIALSTLLFGFACGSPGPRHDAEAPPAALSADAHSARTTNHERNGAVAPSLREGASSIVSNGGTYRVHYRTAESTPPRGDLFAIDVWVTPAAESDAQAALRDVTVTVDAAMPDHEHGMNRIPVATSTGDGHHRIEGMLFHMSGLWQIYFDVTREGITERAQIDVELP